MSRQVRVSYLGPEGTYTHQAARSKFKTCASYVPYGTIASTFESVYQDKADYACIPLENSLHGGVIETLDLLRANRGLYIVGECTIGVDHCLVVRRGVREEEITRVLSHEQALGQCHRFLSTHLPKATLVPTASTASAARQILEREERCSAAICSRMCVDLDPRLEVLRSSIQDGEINYTRFIVLSKLSVPSELGSDVCWHAMLRCVLSPQPSLKTPLTLGSVIKALPGDIELSRVDKRPSLCADPFQDCTFLEVTYQPLPGPQLGTRQAWKGRMAEVVASINDGLANESAPCCYMLGAW